MARRRATPPSTEWIIQQDEFHPHAPTAAVYADIEAIEFSLRHWRARLKQEEAKKEPDVELLDTLRTWIAEEEAQIEEREEDTDGTDHS